MAYISGAACSFISMDVFFVPAEQGATVGLYGLGYRCLHEPASRRLDGEIYCAVHNVSDRNPLINDQVLQARENGEVLVEHCPGNGLAWIETPPFTAELRFAESLLLEGVFTFYRDARKVCATALQARALANEPPPIVSNIVQWRRG
jgi:hypothetical protein